MSLVFGSMAIVQKAMNGLPRMFSNYSPNLNLTTTKPTCLLGALGSGNHLWRRAVLFAGSNKHGSEFVVPLTPGSASITVPDLSTIIRTTTVPS